MNIASHHSKSPSPAQPDSFPPPDHSKSFNREAQFAGKRKAVILSAADAFRRRGYSPTSMADIARTLGLSKAALYYYVKNKEEILFECHMMAYAAMDEILESAQFDKVPDSKPLSGLQALVHIFHKFVEMLTRSNISLLTDIDSLSANHRDSVLRRRQNIETQIIAVVNQGQRDGSIRAGDARLHVFFFMGALNWLNVWFEPDGRVDGFDVTRHFTEQMMCGIAAKGDVPLSG